MTQKNSRSVSSGKNSSDPLRQRKERKLRPSAAALLLGGQGGDTSPYAASVSADNLAQ